MVDTVRRGYFFFFIVLQLISSFADGDEPLMKLNRAKIKKTSCLPLVRKFFGIASNGATLSTIAFDIASKLVLPNDCSILTVVLVLNDPVLLQVRQ